MFSSVIDEELCKEFVDISEFVDVNLSWLEYVCIYMNVDFMGVMCEVMCGLIWEVKGMVMKYGDLYVIDVVLIVNV